MSDLSQTLPIIGSKPASNAAERPIRLDVAGLTDAGKERSRNEDSFLIAGLERRVVVLQSSMQEDPHHWLGDGRSGTLLVVADGMGGQGDGDIASRVAVQSITEYVLDVMPWLCRQTTDPSGRTTLPGVREELAHALRCGDSSVRTAAAKPGAAHTMGTTLTMAFLRWPFLYVGHAGDSRCYLLRDGKLRQLTRDHTVAQRMADAGGELPAMPPEWHHMLWNALGGGENAEFQPEVTQTQLEPGDSILLCSDGLTTHVSDEEIRAHLGHGASASAVAAELVRAALAGGGSDNITVVVARST